MARDRFANVELLPIFFPGAQIIEGIKCILAIALAIETAHQCLRRFVFFPLVEKPTTVPPCGSVDDDEKNKKAVPKSNGKKTDDIIVPTNAQISKSAVQFTHFLCNAVLAAMGCYFWYVALPQKPSPLIAERLMGHTDMCHFGYFMVAYNLWNWYIAKCFGIKDDFAMQVHHIMTTAIGVLTAFTNYGWRYYSPFFGGVVEASSMTLSVMNAFKSRPDWRESMPELFQKTRLAFAYSFIIVRGFSWFQYVLPLIHDSYAVVTSPSVPVEVQVMIGLATLVPAILLSCLQLMWLQIIMKGLIEKLFPSKSAAVDEVPMSSKEGVSKKACPNASKAVK